MMDKNWKYLIALGVLFLIGVIAWELYQISDGGRNKFNMTVIDLEKSVLFDEKFEKFLDGTLQEEDVETEQ